DLVEELTYHAKASATAPLVEYIGVMGRFTEFDEHLTALHATVPEGTVRRDDMRLRIALYRVTWVPSTYDSGTRADGSTGRVLSTRGGPGHPWWILQVRRVMPTAVVP